MCSDAKLVRSSYHSRQRPAACRGRKYICRYTYTSHSHSLSLIQTHMHTHPQHFVLVTYTSATQLRFRGLYSGM